MKRLLLKKNHTGFTLIEIIVSLALFSVVITIAVGALLILIASNRQLQDQQATLSNLSFALDSMTREIRTGSRYFCTFANSADTGGRVGMRLFTSSPSISVMNATDATYVQDCSTGSGGSANFHGISFIEGGASVTSAAANRRIAYFYDRAQGKLFRRLSGQTPESIVSDGIYISDANFFVTGTGPDAVQPKVTIILEAYPSQTDAAADPTGARAEIIQTTVTQRALDI